MPLASPLPTTLLPWAWSLPFRPSRRANAMLWTPELRNAATISLFRIEEQVIREVFKDDQWLTGPKSLQYQRILRWAWENRGGPRESDNCLSLARLWERTSTDDQVDTQPL